MVFTNFFLRIKRLIRGKCFVSFKPPEQVQETVWLKVEEETEKVSKKILSNLERFPELEFLYSHLGSFVFNASQKLIDLKTKSKTTRLKDEAVILSAARLFNDSFAGLKLIKQGLVLQAVVLLRSAFETTTQAILFMENEEIAKKWLAGKEIRPKEVREKSFFAGKEKKLYERLCKLSHPNFIASSYYSVTKYKKGIGFAAANFYGGGYFPKLAIQITVQFLFAQFVFLEAFYTIYKDDLEKSELLWKTGEVEGSFTWERFLKGIRKILTDSLDKSNSLPSDSIEIADYLDKIV